MPVSCTTSPVTHTEVVAVNHASAKGVAIPEADEMGSIKISVPIRMTPAKLRDTTCAELRVKFFLIGFSKTIDLLFSRLIFCDNGSQSGLYRIW